MCGILGLIGSKDIASDLYTGLLELQHRGQDSAGFFIYDTQNPKHPFRKRGLGLIFEEIDKNEIKKIKGNRGLAHVRYATVGVNTDNERRRDAQPTYVSTPGFAMAHNGNLTNVDKLGAELAKCRRYPKSNCDVEVINLLLAEELSNITNSGEITNDAIFEATKNTMHKLKGSYSVISIIQDVGFLAFRDPHAIRPLVMGENSEGGIAFASENVAFEKIGYKLCRDVKGGEAIFISDNGNLESRLLIESDDYHCMFENVYFSRPSTRTKGESVYVKRLNIGRELAYELQGNNPDIVERIDRIAPVPDTSRPTALNLARKLKKDYIEVFDKNRYLHRSFIQSEQSERKETVIGKLSPIVCEIEGYSIGIVDDSVVRGNTAKRVVSILQNSGAKEVHYIVACPPIIYPCHLGIDMPTYEELIAYQLKTIEQIKEFIGSDSLIYISQEGLERAMGGKKGHCYGCTTGESPVPCSDSFSKARKKDRESNHFLR